MKNIKYQATNFFKSQGHARSGIRLIFKNERNFRIDLVVAIVVIILGFLFKISHTDWIAISLVISMVFILSLIHIFPEKEDLIDMYLKNWVGVGYESSKHEELRKEEGMNILKNYYCLLYTSSINNNVATC